MIIIKTDSQIAAMKKAGLVAYETLELAQSMITDGISTKAVDREIAELIKSRGGKASFLGYNGYPASACISLNEEVIHGIPSARKIHNGDLVKIDVGVILDGFHADTARTITVGKVSNQAQELTDKAKEAFYKGCEKAIVGNYICDIANAVQSCVEGAGFSVVREWTGHGVGMSLHEDPSVPNYYDNRRGARLREGMTIAIEPMINVGACATVQLDDGWTVVTADRSLSAHYEHTIAITANGPQILTLPN